MFTWTPAMVVPEFYGAALVTRDLFIKVFGLWMLTKLSHGLLRVYRCWRVGRKLRHLPTLPCSLLGPVGSKCKPADRHRVYGEWAQKYGPILTYRFLTTHVVMVTDPVLVAEALRHRSLDKALPVQQFTCGIDELTGPNAHKTILTMSTDELWRAVRKAVATAFSNRNLRANFPGIRTAGAQLIQVLAEAGPSVAVDMDNATCRESLDVIGHVGFGRDMGATRSLMDGDESGQAITTTQAGLAEAESRIIDPLRRYKLWRPDVWAGKAATRRYHEMIHRLMADIRRERPPDVTIAAHLLDIVDPRTGQAISNDVLQPQIAQLFFAGFETTGHQASWTLYAVSQEAAVEAKITEELASLGLLATSKSPQPRQLEWDDLRLLTYLNAVIKESMRIYAVAGVVPLRSPIKGCGDVVLGGGKLVIPEGAILHTPIAAIQLSPALWDDPEKFDPGRWLQEGNAENVPNAELGGKDVKRYLPFSEGLRNCVAKPLAQLNLLTALAQLYGSFTFRLASEMGTAEDVRAAEQTHVTLSCARGMKMHAVPRVASVKAGPTQPLSEDVLGSEE
ncbi:cytochrome P450 [Coccomyxa subellipsoidea C-169]|uniref:Cytochrome P450 n=1 Tax=Coccomyxa subellipsoidea (strain C-169) TaxID=574566 RepID=I0YPC5_COCSC|nr:cytochrome P450 [Coccomyxa subellipsoidea C-169]EIE20244.1 cytochrome P450 [Coccomyxa subellipsoidea C-169]|eukprot:XP_005644788.1 cytochrome P450 [Coccomyxa subellipsoidea C-169]